MRRGKTKMYLMSLKETQPNSDLFIEGFLFVHFLGRYEVFVPNRRTEPQFFAFLGVSKVKNFELLYFLASVRLVYQVGIRMAARVSQTKLLNVQVHVTLGGHFRLNVGFSNLECSPKRK